MIKAIGTHPRTGRKTLFLGLSFRNLEILREQPLDTYITINGPELGLDVDVIVVAGQTEAELAAFFARRDH